MLRFRVVRGDPEDIGGSGIPGTEGENGGALLYGGPKRTKLFRAIQAAEIVPKRHRQASVLAQMSILDPV